MRQALVTIDIQLSFDPPQWLTNGIQSDWA